MRQEGLPATRVDVGEGASSGASGRLLAWLPWILLVLSLALTLLYLYYLYLNRSAPIPDTYGIRGFQALYAITFSLIGALIATRHPGNVIGWIFCCTGIIAAFQGFAVEYSVYGFFTAPGAHPFLQEALWLQFWIWIPMIFPLIVFVPLLFPDGRLPSPRWRPVAWLALVAVLINAVAYSLLPGPIGEEFTEIANPYGLEGQGALLNTIFEITVMLVFAIGLIAAGSFVLRLRRSTGIERQQLKWLGYVLLISAITAPLATGAKFGELLAIAGWLLVPISVGIAILRYRLYDIDLLINRTLVYGPLTVTMALVYFGGVVLLQAIFRALTGQGSQLAIVASTLVIAALFNPLRRNLQEFIDRRFYRRKYDAAQVLHAFGATLRHETDLDHLTGSLLQVVDETMQPTHVALWLRDPPRRV